MCIHVLGPIGRCWTLSIHHHRNALMSGPVQTIFEKFHSLVHRPEALSFEFMSKCESRHNTEWRFGRSTERECRNSEIRNFLIKGARIYRPRTFVVAKNSPKELSPNYNFDKGCFIGL